MLLSQAIVFLSSSGFVLINKIRKLMTAPPSLRSMNTSIFTCYTFPTYFIIQSKLTSATVLHIDRKSKKLTLRNKTENYLAEKNYVARKFSSFLGIAEIEGIRFIVFCEECKLLGHQNIKICEISSMFFVCYLKEAELVYTGRKHEVLKKTHDMNQFFSRGFYFSYDYNITQTLQFQNNPYAQQFTWNKSYLRSIKKHASKEWINPIIQGYVGTFTTELLGAQIEYFLISRRSCEKGGTRYFDRGVNEQGYVANFVQTEQIVYIGTNFVASDVLIRGSVPIYFEQTGLTTKVKISRSNQLARESFEAHINYCLKRYQRVFIVNLLDTEKTGEKTILAQYQRHIKQITQSRLKYFYYNFHQKCPNNTFQNVNKAIDGLQEMQRNIGYYLVNTQNNTTVNRQMGVFRVNCLDCLDRTNVFESKLAASSLEFILLDLGLNIQDVTKCKLIEEMDKNKDALQLVRQFKNLWADNGDQISFHYTGTGSTHSDFTRSGTRGIAGIFKHKVKTITRFYNQNFWDFNKMKIVDLVLQSNKSQLENQRIPSMMRAKQNAYCSYRQVSIEILAWKVSKMDPYKDSFPFKSSDIYIIGLQSIESSSVSKWASHLQESIQKCYPSQKYIQLVRCYGNNNLCIGFIKSELKSSVSNIQSCSIKFSNLFNYLSNKSATVIRFQLDDNSIVLGSCQLEYGSEYFSNRIDNLREIYRNAFQEEIVGKKKSTQFDAHNYQFLFGNLNMTLTMEEQSLKRKMKELVNLNQQSKVNSSLEAEVKNRIKELLKCDEFIAKDQNSVILRDYEEPAITFVPGYKYEKGKIKLDESRSPGWADRIFYSSERHVECISYDLVEVKSGVIQIYMSDHLPIHGQYKIVVEREDPVKKQEAYLEILKQLRIEKPDVDQEQQRMLSLTRITEKELKAQEDR